MGHYIFNGLIKKKVTILYIFFLQTDLEDLEDIIATTEIMHQIIIWD